MANESIFDTLQWYVVQTHPKQEDRAFLNLTTWNVEVFYPRYRQQRYNEFSGTSASVKPLFPRYVFARFRISDHYHKIKYTRGVHSLVSFNDVPTPVDDEIIQYFQARVQADGLVKIMDDLKPGDEVIIKKGPLANLTGVFEHGIKDTERVMILLQAVNYQARIMINRSMIEAATHAAVNVSY